MNRKSVKKLTNRIKKFSTIDHFRADLDGICLDITDENDTFTLCANAHRVVETGNPLPFHQYSLPLFHSRQKPLPLRLT